MRIFFFVIVFISGLLFYSPQHLSSRDTGFKYHKNYSPGEYNWGHQNWSILQDNRGIIYVGNNNGLLEFDGVSWRKIIIPNNSVRSMALDKNSGTVYIGGKDEIGFLAPDSKGTLQYVSLLDRLNNDKRKFSNVLGTHSTKEGIYFRTYNYLFYWNFRQLKVLVETDNSRRFRGSFICGGKLFIRRDKVGLMQLANDTLELVPGCEIFASVKIFMMTRCDNQELLIGTRSNGFYKYDFKEAGVVRFETEADDYLKDNQLSHGIRLRSGDFASATRQGGFVIIDPRGGLKQIYTKNRGLLVDSINYMYEDPQGNLWLALDKGISKIELASPISFYDNRSDLPGNVLSVVKHGPSKDLYSGTTRGLYYLASQEKFRPIPGMTGYCNFLLSTGDSLLAAASYGVFRIENNRKREIIKTYSYFLHRSHRDKNRIWVGTVSGLVSLYAAKDKTGLWKPEHKFENITQEIRTIVEDKNGNLWLGTITEGVIKVDFPEDGEFSDPVVTRYDVGLTEMHVFMAAGHVMFATANGIYRFDEKEKKVIPDPTLGNEFADGSRGIFRIAEDKNNHLWLHSEYRNMEAGPQPDGTFSLNTKPFFRIPRVQVNAIYPDPVEDIVWFATNDALLRFDKTVNKDYNREFTTIIRKAWVNGKLVFDGYKADKTGINAGPGYHLPPIEHMDRNIRFEFAAPFFEAEEETRYRYFLEGYEENWSEWIPETRKDYTNLDSGTYTFRVRAENVYKNSGKEDIFRFKILPPWFKTWWAFSFYAIVLFLLMFFLVKWRSGKLEREKVRLEQIVKERTGEINEKNRQLEKQTDQLKEQSEKLKEMDKVKSRFFANISHEFRTPLTLIMGPLEQMLSTGRESEEEQKRKLGLMLRNSQRLLTLINQLLELSKIESGKMKLQTSRHDIIPFIKGITASFESVADKNELDLTFRTEEENITLYFDPGKLEDVILNLLSNAVKFTPPGGRITVTVSRNQPDEGAFPTGSVTVSVSDTGPGIPRDQLEHIFDRFYQSDSTYEHHGKGSGIGLTIAKELVVLHGGKIDVHSLEGKGTEFIIRLPMPGPGVPVDNKGVPADYKGAPGVFEVEPVANGDTVKTADEKDMDVVPGDLEKNIILVVEDNTDARGYIRDSLEPDYSVVEAKDGAEGIEKAQVIIPDLIISDIMMPGVDGYELCRVLKNDVRTSHIPIILLTAKASETDIVQGLETGADDYITKPFSTRILGARIKNLIDLRSQLQQTQKREMTLQPVKMDISLIDKKFIKRLKEVIKENIADPDFNIEEMCRKMDMSQPTLYRKIHALTGESPTEFIRSYRLKRGAELLKNNFGTVVEVAFEVGFSSANYFTKCFKKRFHQLPTTYKENVS